MSFIQNLFGQPDIEKLITRRDTNGLAKALNYNKDANIRLAAVKALSKIGDKQAIEYLIAALNNDDVQVRIAAVRALGQIGNFRATHPLLSKLGDSDSGVRKNVITALGKIRDNNAVEPLITLLQKK